MNHSIVGTRPIEIYKINIALAWKININNYKCSTKLYKNLMY